MATVYRRSPTGPWWGSYYKNGERVRFSTGERNRRLAQEKADAREKAETTPLRNELRFLVAAARFFTFKKKLKPGTVARYKTAFVQLESFFGDFVLQDLTPHDLQRYAFDRHKAGVVVAPKRELGFLSSLYTLASKWPDGPTNNPFKEFPLTQLPEAEQRKVWLTRQDEEKLLKACRFPYQTLFITLAVDTGMRRSELLGLTWDEIDFDEEMIFLGNIDTDRTKGGEGRMIPLTHRCLALLRDTKAGTRSPWVFPSPRSNGPRKGVFNWFDRVREEAKLKHVRVHDLRHTFGSKSLQSGVDTPTIMHVMGHRSVRSHLRYAHPSKESIKRAIQRIDTTRSQ